MNATFRRWTGARLPLALACLLAVTACGGAGDQISRAAAAPVSTERVRELVRQFGEGGHTKDVALGEIYAMGAAARPALLEVVQDPATSPYDLESLIFIISLHHCTPEMFDALRTRIGAVVDVEWRQLRLQIVDGLQAQGACIPAG